MRARNQLPTLDAGPKSAKIPKSHYGGGGGVDNELTTFDAESKSAKKIYSTGRVFVDIFLSFRAKSMLAGEALVKPQIYTISSFHRF